MAFRIPSFTRQPPQAPGTTIYVSPDDVNFPSVQKNLNFTNPAFTGYNFIPTRWNKMSNLPSARQLVNPNGPVQS